MSCPCRRKIPGEDLDLKKGEDYDSPVKRSRLQFMQAEHTKHKDIAELEGEEGPMPDTLRIGIRMRYFAVAPNNICKNEWIAYTLYHLYDRLTNYWNLLMYFCYDSESEKRLNKARSIRYYGVDPAKPLTTDFLTKMRSPNNQCKLDSEWKNTSHNPTSSENIESYPQFTEALIEHLGLLRQDRKVFPGIDDAFPAGFAEIIKPTYKNFIPFFTHVYRNHYRALCGMGVLLHFNSFFMNILHQGLSYGFISEGDVYDKYLWSHYQRIYNEEEQRVKGGM